MSVRNSSLACLVGGGVTDAQELVYALALEDLAEVALQEKAGKPETKSNP